MEKGHAVSKGIGIGKVLIYQQFIPQVEPTIIEDTMVEQTYQDYLDIQAKANQEIEQIVQLLISKQDEKHKIFEAHLEIINDVAMAETIENFIKTEHYGHIYAIDEAYKMFIEMLETVDDDLIRERIADLKDVKNRLLRIAYHVPEKNLSRLFEKTIVVALDLYPSDTATLDRNMVEAIVTEVGGPTSHTAIIAKSYQIPAILGVKDAMKTYNDGDTLIVDALSNELILNPTDAVIQNYIERKKRHLEQQNILKTYLDKTPITKDGIKVDVTLNIGSASKEEIALEPYVDGIGLFRSEFLYMENTHLPTEDEQYEVYKRALEGFKGKPVILRTLDIGGDKTLSYMALPKEENPFLGLRAVRLCFAHLDIFKTQLKAAYRASVHGNLWLMFPMVGSMDDIHKIKSVIEEVKSDLDSQQIPYSKDVKIGVMIEIPSIILVIDHVAKAVDFASIGTNDLCQYLSAVDRMNPLVSSYYQSYSPSMIRILKMAIDGFNAAGKPISVCGELGGDLIAAPILMGLGMKKLSMSKSSLAPIKHLIVHHTMDTFKSLAQKAVTLETEKEVIELVQKTLQEASHD
ncbi:phosphoenolpyruvate--protein phosphotransferase [Paracholeplasma manati]|uniref:Phosphoenolpyruvate-protein phosphotransferase n=1 Tax=Paracholeplasma manati TaxID=591373 RepID=A0ABT2Y7G7_9MOLU|nr:phosphoenolpyruvate--protein phosphotransferase [Paracholeplasma manati]MCV2232689.1 phosphoenolpyruvate--protein phosphotransferase [Paracholeplasma manati]MDG0889564.1 phosphoenolpyruvate--protein phosphotransferase [Paracholeplasma manati]